MSEVVEQIETNEQIEQPTEQTEEEPKIKRPRGRPRKNPQPPPKIPKEERIKKTENMSMYMKAYYVAKLQKDRNECICHNCNKNFNTAYALKRHHKTSQACMLIKLKTKLNNLLNDL